MARTFIRITGILLALAMLLHTGDACAQKMYSLGGASVLQTIDITDYKVVDHATLIPSMSDIAFHPDGTLYGVNENSIYKIDTTDGSSQVVKQLPVSLGWLVGLTINYDGVFYLSGLGTNNDFVITYDPSNDVVVNLGSTGWRHWDLEFYNGQLYLSGGTENSTEGFLIVVDLSDLSQSKVIVDFGAQAYGMSSFNNACGGDNLVSITSKKIIQLDPEGASFVETVIDDPLYTFSSGATSRTSYLGSLSPIKINTVDVSSTPCDANETGAVEIMINPGRPNVEFSIDGTNYQASPSFNNIPIGIYQAFIRDAMGCTDMSDPFEIKVSTLEFSIQSQPSICGEDNGIIRPVAAINADSIEFSMNGIEFYSDPEFNNLAAGDYTIIGRNKAGCIDSALVIIEEIPMLTHQSTTTPEHCEQEDGTIVILAMGGMEPYSYTIVALAPQPEPIFTGLHASTFLLRVEDVLGCISEGPVDVEAAPGPAIEDIIIQEAHCGMPDGSAEVIASPAAGNVQYSINNGPFTTNTLFTDLNPGIYTLGILDEFGCDTTTTFVIPAKDGPVIQSSKVVDDYCNSAVGIIEINASSPSGNLTYSLDSGPFLSTPIFTGLTMGVYLVTVRDEFGCDVIEYIQVDEEPAPIIENIEIVDATCNAPNGLIFVSQSTSNGARYSLDNIDFQLSPEFINISAGDYTVYLVDNNGCMDSTEISLTNIEQALIIDISTTDVTCQGSDGALTIHSSLENNNTQYSIDGSSFQANNIFKDLNSKNYTGYLIDENGCLDSMQIMLQGKEGIILNDITTTPANCENSNGTMLIRTEGAVEIILNSEITYYSKMIEDLPPGNYDVRLTNDSGCTLDTIVKIDGANCNVYVPNAFSPNGDGVNESMSPFFDPAQFQLLQFQVYDRWGNTVFNCRDLCEWDGTNRGKPSPAGVYIYFMQIKDEAGDISNMSGDVTLLR